MDPITMGVLLGLGVAGLLVSLVSLVVVVLSKRSKE